MHVGPHCGCSWRSRSPAWFREDEGDYAGAALGEDERKYGRSMEMRKVIERPSSSNAVKAEIGVEW